MSYLTARLDDRIATILKDGGIGFLPSDTIYGLSCRALDEEAVERLHNLKVRDKIKPFIILIADYKMLDMLSIEPDETIPILKYWPGPLTAILSASESPAWLQLGTKTLAVRIPAYPALIKLLKEVGPIVSTSANRSGTQPLNSIAEAQEEFGEELDFYVDQGNLGESLPSTIVKISGGELEVIRQGTVKIDDKEKN